MQRNDRILIVDDNESVHVVFRATLQPPQFAAASEALGAVEYGGEQSGSAASYKLAHAYDGKSGLREVEDALKRGEPFAMAIVDIQMPGEWDGVETVAELLKADPEILVVICSAFTNWTYGEIVASLNSTRRLKFFLKTPFEFDEVRDITAEVVGEWNQACDSRTGNAADAPSEEPEHELQKLSAPEDLAAVDLSMQEDYFVLLCLEGRLEHYREDLVESPLTCLVLHSLQEVAMHAIVHAPRAVFCDVVTQTRIGFVTMAGLYDLKVNWPVLKCGPRPGSGVPMAMCLDPNRSAALNVAMAEIARDEVRWRRTRFPSRYKPLEVNYRCEFRPEGESSWRRSSVVALCADRVSLISYDDMELGTTIEVRILGFAEAPLLITGCLTTGRSWRETDGLPGFDVEIAIGTERDRLTPELLRPEFVKLFLNSR